jgi:hypothetical protein
MEEDMKKIAVVAVGVVVALTPAGTAFAGDTGNGKAWGNCQNSSAGGVLAPVMDSAHGRGNGGLVEVAKSGAGCVSATSTAEATPVYDEGDH